jgi:hypothetical protein
MIYSTKPSLISQETTIRNKNFKNKLMKKMRMTLIDLFSEKMEKIMMKITNNKKILDNTSVMEKMIIKNHGTKMKTKFIVKKL